MASPLRQPLGTFTEAGHHPSRGGNPYSDDFRNDVVTRYQLGIPLDTPTLKALRDEHAYPHLDTCMRYLNQYQDVGHVQPKMATGNHSAEREVVGQALVRLALFTSIDVLQQN